MFDAEDDEIAALVTQAEAKRGELKDNSSPAECERIVREHDEIVNKLDEARERAGAGKQTRDIRVSTKDARAFQGIGDQNGIRSLVDRWIDEGLDREAIGRRVIDELARRESMGSPQVLTQVGDPTIRGQAMSNADTLDNPAFVRRSIENALYARMSGKEPEGAAREFVGRRLDDLDNILAEARGERRSWRESRESSGFHTTSDFPNLLTGAGNRVLQDAYQAASSPLMALAKVRNSTDFRPINVLKLSEAPALEKVGESGEVKYGSRGEETEAFKVETFAKIFSLSRQAWLNDDLGAFADFNTAFGRASAETVASQLVALFTANSGDGATLADGNPLFHAASRKNKAASGTIIDIAALAAARQALRETKGLDGVTPIGLTPKYLVVSPAKETQAEQTLSAILANQVSNANPFAQKLELLVEPRFTGNVWRVFAETAQQAVLSIAYLNGARGPMLEQREGWTTLGVEFRAVLDFGCGITDWRGAYLNAGA